MCIRDSPYSWNMDFFEYEDGSGYEARFTTCGICTLMQVLGPVSYTHLDVYKRQVWKVS